MSAKTSDIAAAVEQLVQKAPAGGLFTTVQTQRVHPNAFCMKLEDEGPIYTVRVEYGGAMIVAGKGAA